MCYIMAFGLEFSGTLFLPIELRPQIPCMPSVRQILLLAV
uniref:Uncharacterized protein n=1 Tax=Rhizophora mucronata TaxID=61149 RepID=A0A2P2NKA4_RHIMU